MEEHHLKRIESEMRAVINAIKSGRGYMDDKIATERLTDWADQLHLLTKSAVRG